MIGSVREKARETQGKTPKASLAVAESAPKNTPIFGSIFQLTRPANLPERGYPPPPTPPPTTSYTNSQRFKKRFPSSVTQTVETPNSGKGKPLVLPFAFFPGMLLARKPPQTQGNGRFLTRTMVEQNGESTLRTIGGSKPGA